MSIESLAPWLLLAASFAAGVSGLLVHSQLPHDVARPASKAGDALTRYRRIANSLFVLSLVMLGWAGLWLLGTHAANLAGNFGHGMHNVLAVGVAVIAALGGYWRKRERKRDERR